MRARARATAQHTRFHAFPQPPLPPPLHHYRPQPSLDEEDGKPRHECGVFGVFLSPSAAAAAGKSASRVAFFALYALNHRGQESAGIASYSPMGMHVHRGMGLVSQVFTETDIEGLRGTAAIGHTRYSTAGGSALNGAQPFVLETDLGMLAIAHNGQLARQEALRRIVLARGTGLFTNSDSELIAQTLARPHDVSLVQSLLADLRANSPGAPLDDSTLLQALGGAAGGGSLDHSAPLWPAWFARIAAFMHECEGAYSFVALTKVRAARGRAQRCAGTRRAAARFRAPIEHPATPPPHRPTPPLPPALAGRRVRGARRVRAAAAVPRPAARGGRQLLLLCSERELRAGDKRRRVSARRGPGRDGAAGRGGRALIPAL
jgi:hypothetical protein